MDQTVEMLFLSHQGYLKKVVKRFKIHKSKLVDTPSGHHHKHIYYLSP